MARFAARTGLASSGPGKRYLWTDAFAVCNWLGLSRITGEPEPRELALRLVHQVHETLGRHRGDDGRQGWLSGLPDAEARLHPTAGGLRIGKPLPERGSDEPPDPELEWDRDGQYFHYLTKWMHALDQVSRASGDPQFTTWARELAEVAHRAFTYGTRGGPRMIWKASIDLSRPQVASMGHHDPLDGYVTCLQLDGASLARATADYRGMLDDAGLATTDPLGLGGLLVDAYRLVQLAQDPALVTALLAASALGLAHYVAGHELARSAHRRLGFRELGLAIGLAAVERMRDRVDREARVQLDRLSKLAPVGDQIAAFWLESAHRETRTWLEHGDINDVMLATALVPDGFLELGAITASVPARSARSAPASSRARE
ncbi:MAG TPA: hypothetical protein VFQ53_20555 [Kofleriaceae bacterium]|nr:hypothetical protein [Kofleriaceae bacterium]